MKHIDIWINRCADCPWFDYTSGPSREISDGWCLRCEDEVLDASVIADFCELKDD